MIVAGIDPSLVSAGLAALRNGRPILLTSVGFPNHDAKNWSNRVRRIVAQTNMITSTLRERAGIPDLALVEAPLTFDGVPGDTGYDRYCVFVGICSWLEAHRVPYAVVHNMTRSKWATGRGGSSKKDVLDAVCATWRPWRKHIRNDDIADALTLAEIGARRLDEPLHFTPRRRHIEALAGIDWPSNLCAKPEPLQVGAPR